MASSIIPQVLVAVRNVTLMLGEQSEPGLEWASPSGMHRAPQGTLDRKLIHLLMPYTAFGAGFELSEIAWNKVESKVGSITVLGIDLFCHNIILWGVSLYLPSFQKELFKPFYNLLSYVIE